MADLTAVGLTRYPPALVAALEKLQGTGTLRPRRRPAIAHLWLGDPAPAGLRSPGGWMSRLFETHPPLDARIEALREL